MQKKILYSYFIFNILSLLLGISLNRYELCLIPLGVWLMAQSVIDFRVPYFLLIAAIPISIEYHISPSLGLDLPTEPLMIGLMAIYCISLFLSGRLNSIHKLKNPLLYLLIAGWLWAVVSTLFSSVGFVSVKWLLAKAWYLFACVGVALEVLRSNKDLKTFYFCLIPPLLATIIWALYGQYQDHFAFYCVNKALLPFYRNHVNYGSLLVIAFPFAWFGKQYWQHTSAAKAIWLFSILLLLTGIYFSYCRIAYLSLFVALIAYFVIRFKAIKICLLFISVFAFSAIAYLQYENRFMELAPKYERTTSPKDLNGLVNATYKGQDISSMERVNRWIAASRMITAHLVTGFGPNSFYPQYQKYRLASFKTYVSINKEGSTLHCYYFLLLLEQGIPGFLLFMALVFVFLIRGEKIYHQTDKLENQSIVMASMLSQVIIFCILLLNDMIETDKVGILFYTNIAILLNYDVTYQKK